MLTAVEPTKYFSGFGSYVLLVSMLLLMFFLKTYEQGSSAIMTDPFPPFRFV